jgi:hypothetical protein
MDAPVLLEIPVDVLPPTELTKLKAGMADAKDGAPLAPKEEAPKPKAVAAPKPEEPEAAKPSPEKNPAEAKSEPKPAEAKKPEPEKKAEKPKEPAKEPPKKVEAKPDKPKPKKSLKSDSKRDFNTDRIAALLNKIPDAPREPVPDEALLDTPQKPVHGQSSGTKMTMSVNEIDALRARIAQCWNPPPGGLGADAIIVKLRLKLNEDGSLIGYPSIVNSGSSPFFQAAADSAVRAVFQCQPYTLPGDKYSVWRDMILTFDPRQMYSSG